MRMEMKMKIKIRKKKIVKDANIQKLIEESKEMKSPNWLDENKF